jgi:anhydro-N-acetylmuramic acid kinase
VVHDFRARDVAAGGHGAPLVPWVDRLLFSAVGHTRVLQNIGGMANLTWLPARGSAEPLVAFDTGPGNALIDAAVERATLGEESFDRDAHWGEAGTVDEALLAELMAHPYIGEPPPKSTGREVFGRPFVDALLERGRPEGWSAWADLIATLTAFTTGSIAHGILAWLVPRAVDEVIVTGGGARNPLLMALLTAALAPVPVRGGDVLGVDPDAKEAVAFAALAWAHARGFAGNAPEATGAHGPRVLGSRTPA